WSVASAATAFAAGFRGLFAARAAVGIGEASYYPAGTALLSGYFPHSERARVMSRWQAGQIVGMALAFALSAVFVHLFGEALGWRVVFFVAGPPGLVLGVLMWLAADAPAAPAASAKASARSTPSAATSLTVPAQPQPIRAPRLSTRIGAVLRLRTVWLVI